MITSACSAGYNINVWQATSAVARPENERSSSLNADLERVDQLREQMKLSESRELALKLAAENPGSSEVLWRASRAESDAVFLHHEHETDQRSMAALSALDYARRANENAEASLAARAQYAWAMGTSTHLQPMMKRSKHAQQTKAIIQGVLAEDPTNATALATDALLNYRLCTLPWIAKAMARSAPKADLGTAEKQARAAYDSVPSIENAIILAKILYERDKDSAANKLLEEMLDLPDRFPRDREMRDSARGFLTKSE